MTELSRRVVRAYESARVATRAALDAVTARQAPPHAPVRRAFQALATLPDEALGLSLALVELEERRDDLAARLALTGVLAMGMGRRAGLPPSAVRDLASAAALSGAGRVLHMGSEHASPDALEATHSFEGGARALLADAAPDRALSLTMIAAAEQRSATSRRGGHAVGRLTAVASAYERLTCPPPIGSGVSSLDALARMLERKDLDRDQVALLARTLGPFAPGSAVRLDTGEAAVVRDPPAPATPADRPAVLVVTDASGAPVDPRPRDLVDGHASVQRFIRQRPSLARALFASSTRLSGAP